MSQARIERALPVIDNRGPSSAVPDLKVAAHTKFRDSPRRFSKEAASSQHSLFPRTGRRQGYGSVEKPLFPSLTGNRSLEANWKPLFPPFALEVIAVDGAPRKRHGPRITLPGLVLVYGHTRVGSSCRTDTSGDFLQKAAYWLVYGTVIVRNTDLIKPFISIPFISANRKKFHWNSTMRRKQSGDLSISQPARMTVQCLQEFISLPLPL
ncbi:hypothetical protein C8R45DRAFT_928026 [Mycena sanguinolenta]|nr:hypothetical protein C8R45DRAFT_928026 [Mycena sanguinolenta]